MEKPTLELNIQHNGSVRPRVFYHSLLHLTDASPHACLLASSGRVDAVVQSTDKNFMVPVGGAVVSAWGWWGWHLTCI